MPSVPPPVQRLIELQEEFAFAALLEFVCLQTAGCALTDASRRIHLLDLRPLPFWPPPRSSCAVEAVTETGTSFSLHFGKIPGLSEA